MDSLVESAAHVQALLEASRIRSAVIGGVALGVWGRARATKDVDLKLSLLREDAGALLGVLGRSFEMVTPEPYDALERLGFVFVRDEAGVRIDLLLSDNDFDAEVLRRARAVEPRPGVRVRVCTPEDLVIYKLVATRPHDQVDAESVILRQGKTLDRMYIERWLRQFEAALDDSTLVDTFRRMCSLIR